MPIERVAVRTALTEYTAATRVRRDRHMPLHDCSAELHTEYDWENPNSG